MWNSRDVALIIMFAVLSFVFQVLIGQIPNLITGIAGIGYVFTIVYSITQTVAWLMFGGRRWRFFSQGLLFTLLCLSVIQSWTPPVVMATILNVLIADLIFNSFHGTFERKNKLVWWAILTQGYYWTTHPLLVLSFSKIFFPVEAVAPIMSLILPLMIIEAIAGSYIGYTIYRRVEKLA